MSVKVTVGTIAMLAGLACMQGHSAAEPSKPSKSKPASDQHDRIQDLIAASKTQQGGPPAKNAPALAGELFLGTFGSAQVRSAVGRDNPPGQALEWRIRDWKGRQQTVIALSFVPVPVGGDPREMQAQLNVLEKRDAKLASVASVRLSLPVDACRDEAEQSSDEAPDLELDAASYTIAPKAAALGVRFSCHGSAPASESSQTRLSLIELHCSELREIFAERVEWLSDDRAGGIERREHASVSIQPSSHAGYFDLVLRSQSQVAAIGSDRALGPRAPRAPEHKQQTRRFVWNGTRYAALP